MGQAKLTFTGTEGGNSNVDTTPKFYTVTFDTDGGTAVNEQIVKPGAYLVNPYPYPTKEGYDFDGWKKADGTKFIISTTPVNSDMTLTAIWV